MIVAISNNKNCYLCSPKVRKKFKQSGIRKAVRRYKASFSGKRTRSLCYIPTAKVLLFSRFYIKVRKKLRKI